MAKTILLADDSVTIQKVVELTFMGQDYQVVAVSDGTTAVTRLSELKPDLVIADVHMPGENGYEVCRQAKQIHPGIPVLLLVGTFEPFDQERATSVGADSHLKKPFDSQDLLQQVDRLISEAQGRAPGVAEAAAAMAPEPPAMPPVAVSPPAMEPEPMPVPAAPAPSAVPPVEAVPVAMPSPPVVPVIGVANVDSVTPEPVAPEPVAVEPMAVEPMASEPPAPAAPAPAAPPSAGNGSAAELSDEDVERIARRVAELVGDKVVREVAWEVIPDLAEVVIRERIRELEGQIE